MSVKILKFSFATGVLSEKGMNEDENGWLLIIAQSGELGLPRDYNK